MRAAPPLPRALDAERREIVGRAGRLACYVAGEGEPLLLLHSINAAASAYEVRPIFDRLRASRRVFAPDLPGFGASERSRRDYDVALYVAALHDVLDAVGDERGPAPLDALALSLGCEFLARAARDRPRAFRSLAFVSPTGLDARSGRLRGPEGSTREIPLLHALVSAAPWRGAPFRWLTRPASIRYFLRRTWGADAIDEGLAAYAERTAREPGAEHAPYAFLSGRLFSRDIRNVYDALRQPVWVAHGTRGDFQDYGGVESLCERLGWTRQVFEAGALPHFEHPASFCEAYERFVAGVSTVDVTGSPHAGGGPTDRIGSGSGAGAAEKDAAGDKPG